MGRGREGRWGDTGSTHAGPRLPEAAQEPTWNNSQEQEESP